MHQVELSFVVPAYNEEEVIESALLTLETIVKPKNLQYEIVVVNDGSNDKTLIKARNYASKNGHVRVVSYSTNLGKGHAVKTGFMKATGDIIILVDGDMDINLGQVSRYIKALEHADLVIATKWHPDSIVSIPTTRRILSHSFNVLVRILTGANLKDTQAGLKVMKKSVFENIFPRLCVKRYAFDVELLAVAKLFGLKVAEMPVKINMDASFNLRDICRMLVDLLGITYRLRVLHWYQRSCTQ
jgi:glycosyltransferase involved in cell wall biosynthesis